MRRVTGVRDVQSSSGCRGSRPERATRPNACVTDVHTDPGRADATAER
jgi:hypothetical protein